MRMRKSHILIFLTSLFIVGILAGYFWLGGRINLTPVLLPPPGDISSKIEDRIQDTDTPSRVGDAVDFPLYLPEGFAIRIFAKNLGPVRVLAWDPNGTLLASITKENRVVALPDRNHDGKADEVTVLRDNLDRPHGLAFRNGFLYIAESTKVSRFRYDADAIRLGEKEELFLLPDHEGHFTRTIGFDDAGNLYTSVGSSCNVCDENDWRRAKMLISDEGGKNLRVFAAGLRNAVFFVFHPQNGELWTTEMGRDWLGDDLPPDEINIVREGRDYGWPICYGANVHDSDFDKKTYVRNPCEDTTPSFIDIPAHSAPLGLRFVPNGVWGEDYDGDLLVSLHGSWNRSEPAGYGIIRYDFEGGVLREAKEFVTGWLTEDDRALGRPVDLIFAKDGVLYVSDDKAGVIYTVFQE